MGCSTPTALITFLLQANSNPRASIDFTVLFMDRFDGFLHFPVFFTSVAFGALCPMVRAADRNIQNTTHGSDRIHITGTLYKVIR